jgi:hypothetical protein
MLENFQNLREFDGGGSGDDGVTEEFGNEREQAIFVGDVSIAKRSNCTAQINT